MHEEIYSQQFQGTFFSNWFDVVLNFFFINMYDSVMILKALTWKLLTNRLSHYMKKKKNHALKLGLFLGT